MGVPRDELGASMEGKQRQRGRGSSAGGDGAEEEAVSYCYSILYIARGETITLSSLPGMYSLLIHIIDVPMT